jgi:predicted dehydrogenase
VLCEKPMARTLAEADAMLAAAEAHGVHFMVAHSRRFTARYRRARELLDGGAIGRPIFVRENERRSRTAPPRLNVPVSGWRPDPTRATTWYAQARYSVGTALHIGVHEMDLYRWFAGSEARSVYMESKITGADMEVPDTVAIQVKFDSGALAAGEIVTQAPVGYPDAHEFEIFGTEGVLRSRDLDSHALRHVDANGMHFPTAAESLLLVHDAYFLEQRLFFESIVNDTSVPLDPHESRAALELALAAVQSSATGQHVSLPLGVGQ